MTTIVPSLKSIGAALVLLLLGVAVGWGARPTFNPSSGGTEIRTEAPEDFVREFQRISVEALEARRESEALRGRVRQLVQGVEAREPDVIVRTDTVLVVPDTVATGLSVDVGGELRVPTLRRDTSVADSLRVPEIIEYRDVWECEDGFSVSVTGAILKCNKARLGHLSVTGGVYGTVDGPDVGAGVDVGARWTPRYRSPWAVEGRYRIMQGAWEVRFVRWLEIPLP